jgi:hypothetical protein
MGRAWSEVLAGFAVNALALVATVIDALATSAPLERGVREVSPPSSRLLHPLATVERATLWTAAALGVR